VELAARRRHHLDELADLWSFAATLDGAALTEQSLCEGWTVADVLGHVAAWERLLGYDRAVEHPVRLVRLGIAAVRAAGSTKQLNKRLGAAAWPPATLSRRHVFDRLSPGAQLAELVIHHQDIRRPLGAPRDIPPERLELALDGVVRLPGVGARRRASELRGQPPTEELLLRLAGRSI